ncbi:MAG: hypothetical protein ACHQ50_10510 [Fimbriimonadales bacterium]
MSGISIFVKNLHQLRVVMKVNTGARTASSPKYRQVNGLQGLIGHLHSETDHIFEHARKGTAAIECPPLEFIQ